MGFRVILQKGQATPQTPLPADAAKRVNDVADKSSLEKWVWSRGSEGPEPNIQKQPANPEAATLRSGPIPVVEDQVLESSDDAADDFTLMENVGKNMEQKFNDAGYFTFEDLVAVGAEALDENVRGISYESAVDFIKQAKKFAKMKAEGKL